MDILPNISATIHEKTQSTEQLRHALSPVRSVWTIQMNWGSPLSASMGHCYHSIDVKWSVHMHSHSTIRCKLKEWLRYMLTATHSAYCSIERKP